VTILMELFLRALEVEVAKLHDNAIRLKVVGDTARFDPRIRALIAQGEALTAGNTRLTLTICANYGGRWDIAQAARAYYRHHPEMLAEGAALEPDALAPYLALAHAPSRTSSSAPAARSACRTSCSGSSRTPSSGSPTRCGPTSTRRARRGDRVVPQARAALRPHQRAARRGDDRDMTPLAKRVTTAAVLVPVVLGALFALPPIGWSAFVLALAVVCAIEWSRLAGFGPMATGAFAGAIAAAGGRAAAGLAAARRTRLARHRARRHMRAGDAVLAPRGAAVGGEALEAALAHRRARGRDRALRHLRRPRRASRALAVARPGGDGDRLDRRHRRLFQRPRVREAQARAAGEPGEDVGRRVGRARRRHALRGPARSARPRGRLRGKRGVRPRSRRGSRSRWRSRCCRSSATSTSRG
jgi:hypothetical protein